MIVHFSCGSVVCLKVYWHGQVPISKSKYIELLIALCIVLVSIKGKTPVIVHNISKYQYVVHVFIHVCETMKIEMEKTSTSSTDTYSQNFFHLDLIYLNLISFFHAAVASDPTITADGPMARATALKERILGERMYSMSKTNKCTQHSLPRAQLTLVVMAKFWHLDHCRHTCTCTCMWNIIKHWKKENESAKVLK